MKTSLPLSLATALALASCQGPAPELPAGPRGYSLDHPPGEVRYGEEQPGVPTETRYLDSAGAAPTPSPTQPVPNAPASSTAQSPAIPSGTPPNSTAQPSATQAPSPTPVPAPIPQPTSYPTATRTKPGFVKSPFDPLGREIDVREMR
ncbi:MAG: hypothetical protein ACKO8Z_14615, partial [Prosthecobacter sp.]